VFPEIDRGWFRRKLDIALQLGTRAFSLWEQRPYLMRFENYRPITGEEDFMYQNITLLPLAAAGGEAERVCLLVEDMTEVARLKRQLAEAGRVPPAP
jgi:hypothetical protein